MAGPAKNSRKTTTGGLEAAVGALAPTTGPAYPSRSLFQGGRLVWIEHAGERYALRITKQGKLILTK